VNNPLHVKENDEYALESAIHLSRIFLVSACLDVPCTAHTFFLERLSNHCTFSEISTTFYAVPLSDPSWNHFRPNTRL
jgi:hypothetical protein